jgi:hypothetical protein
MPNNKKSSEFVCIYVLCCSAKVSFMLMCILYQNYIEIALILAISLTVHSELTDFDVLAISNFCYDEIALPLPSVSTYWEPTVQYVHVTLPYAKLIISSPILLDNCKSPVTFQIQRITYLNI